MTTCKCAYHALSTSNEVIYNFLKIDKKYEKTCSSITTKLSLKILDRLDESRNLKKLVRELSNGDNETKSKEMS